MFLGLLDPDPDPEVRGTDPDPSIIKQKQRIHSTGAKSQFIFRIFLFAAFVGKKFQQKSVSVRYRYRT
jgi:hypothetical protein